MSTRRWWRREPRGSRAGLLLTAVFCVLVVGLPLIGTRVFSGADQLYTWEPWSNHTDVPHDISGHLVWDTFDFFQPRLHEMGQRLRAGDIPLTGDAYSGGEPLASVPVTGSLDPLNVPWWFLPAKWAPGYVKLLELIAAIAFTRAFCRRLGTSSTAGLVGGVAFAATGFMITWSNWPQTHTGALIPAMFWATERLIQQRDRRSVGLLALCTAWMLATGFPSVALYTFIALVPYVLVRLFIRGRPDDSPPRRWPRTLTIVLAGAGVTLGVAILALQLGPFADFIKGRLEQRSRLGSKPISALGLVTTILPHGLGQPNWSEYIGPSNLVEDQNYVGIVALVLGVVALFAPVRRIARGVRGYLAITATAMLIAMYSGGPLLKLLNLVPTFRSNGVGRMRSVAGFLLAVLAAIGADALAARAHRRHSARRVAAMAVVGASAAGVVTALAIYWHRHIDKIPASLWYSLATTAVVVLLLGAFLIDRRWHPDRWRGERATVAALLLVGAEGLAFAIPAIPRITPQEYYPRSAVIDAALQLQGLDRVDGDRTLNPGAGTFYGLRSATGHSFTTPLYDDLLRLLGRRTKQTPTYSQLQLLNGARSTVLDRLSVRYLIKPLTDVSGTPELLATPPTTVTAQHPLDMQIKGALRGLYLILPAALNTTREVRATLFDATGAVESTITRTVHSGPGSNLVVLSLAGEDAPAHGTRRVVVELLDGPALPVSQMVVVRPANDGLRLLAVLDDNLYERTGALARYRWASSAQVQTDSLDQLIWLGLPEPADTVLLSATTTHVGSGSGSVTAVDEHDSDDRTIHTSSTGPGWLVIADAYRDGWLAEVDGHAVPVVVADHALMAVEVPAGAHVVHVWFRPPTWPVTPIVSLVAALSAVVMVLVPRRRRRVAPSPPQPSTATGDALPPPSDPALPPPGAPLPAPTSG